MFGKSQRNCDVTVDSHVAFLIDMVRFRAPRLFRSERLRAEFERTCAGAESGDHSPWRIVGVLRESELPTAKRQADALGDMLCDAGVPVDRIPIRAHETTEKEE